MDKRKTKILFAIVFALISMALNVGFIYQIIMNQFWNWDFLETAILFGIWSDIITINQKGV